MPQIKKIVDTYKKICLYCDGFWKKTEEIYPGEILCSVGCSNCCELQSVSCLEAYVIASYLEGRDTGSASRTCCPFLENSRCRIYRARPLICRTHGLLLKSREFSGRITITCPRNFSGIDLAKVDDACALDIDAVSNELAKLNIAFCMLLGRVNNAQERLSLADLADGKIRSSWFGVQIKTADPLQDRRKQ